MHISLSTKKRSFSSSRSWKLFAVGVILQIFTRVQGFIPIPSVPTRKSVLSMAKSRKANGGKNKRKMSSNPKNANKKKPKSNQVKKSGKVSSESESVFLPSQKSRAPPWRVLSPKEAKKNVKKEQKRREMARRHRNGGQRKCQSTFTI